MPTNRNITSSRANGAFSLLELLIVIATIALLVSILAPSLSGVGDAARLAICKTRLHNIGRGLAQYTSEGNIHLPVSSHVNSTHETLLDSLYESRCVADRENFYCPGETDPQRVYSPENAAAGRIAYFYYSCRWATSDVTITGFLRYDVSWPRELTSEMPPDTWVLSDRWFRGRKTTHPSLPKGVNYLTLNGDVGMVESSPSGAFR